MTDKVQSRWRWLSTTLKVLFFGGSFVLILFVMLSSLGGSSDTLKKSIEEFVSESTAFNARVDTLNSMTFFPDISFDFKGMELLPKGKPDVVMAISNVQVSFSFWDVMTGSGKIKVLNIKGLRTLPGVILPEAITINSLEILETVDGPRFVGDGKIGEKVFEISAGMQSDGLGKGRKYSFGSERDFQVVLDKVLFEGIMRTGQNTGIILDEIKIAVGQKPVGTGKIGIVRNAERIDISGDLRIETHASDIQPEIHISQGPVTAIVGNIESNQFHVEDFAPGSAFDDAITTFEKMFSDPDSEVKPDFSLEAARVYKSGASQGSYDGPLPLKAWHIDTKALKVSP